MRVCIYIYYYAFVRAEASRLKRKSLDRMEVGKEANWDTFINGLSLNTNWKDRNLRKGKIPSTLSYT